MIERIKDQAEIITSALSSQFNGTSPFSIASNTENAVKISLAKHPHIYCLIVFKERSKTIRKSTRPYHVIKPTLSPADSDVGLSEQYSTSCDVPDKNGIFTHYSDAIYFAAFELLKLSTYSDG